MKEIPLENLSKFEGIFARDKKKHMVILLTIKTFRQRFELYPELRENAKLYALCDNWETKGIFFFMTFSGSVMENNVYFDCIDDSLHHFEILKRALKSLDYRLMTYFFSIRNEFRDLIFQLQQEEDLKMQEDTNCVCFHMPMEQALQMGGENPAGHTIRALTSDHIELINDAWPHRYAQSELFIAYSIKYHISAGLFDADDNLVAWCLRYDNGSLGVLHVDANHRRLGYGELITKAITKTIAETFHCDVISLVVHENEKSINMFKKLQFRALGAHTWFGFQK